MWLVADLLLAFVVLATLAGFHVGPHSHLAAGIMGVLAAIWLLIMAATGQAAPLLWVALGADVALSAGVGTMALKGIQSSRHPSARLNGTRILGAEGVAETELDPDGIVKVHSETWSATSLNGRIARGTRIQVVESTGVHLGVWGETSQVDGSVFEGIASQSETNTNSPGNAPPEPTTGAS